MLSLGEETEFLWPGDPSAAALRRLHLEAFGMSACIYIYTHIYRYTYSYTLIDTLISTYPHVYTYV